jgi:hypothetical protein
MGAWASVSSSGRDGTPASPTRVCYREPFLRTKMSPLKQICHRVMKCTFSGEYSESRKVAQRTAFPLSSSSHSDPFYHVTLTPSYTFQIHF